WRSTRTPSAVGVRHLGLVAGLFAGVVLIGAVRQQQVQAAADASEHFTVAAVQVDPSYSGSVDKLRDFSRSVQSEAHLICWPESSTGTYDETLTHLRDRSHTIRHSVMPNP